MRLLLLWYGSTVGKKVLMAGTGAILLAYVVAHVLGNLLIFRGPAAINAYGAFLKSLGPLLWFARVVLLAAVGLHITAAVQLTRRSRAARPVPYRRQEPQVSTVAARSIRWGGLAIGLFIVYHVLQLTTGTLHPTFHGADIYANEIDAFRTWWVDAIYLAAMGALGLHLYHGTWSMARTLGVRGGGRRGPGLRNRGGVAAFAVGVALTFSAVPLAVAVGILRPRPAGEGVGHDVAQSGRTSVIVRHFAPADGSGAPTRPSALAAPDAPANRWPLPGGHRT